MKYKGKAAIKTDPVVSTEWGAPDFADEFSGRKLGAAWSDRFTDYNPAGLRRCSKGSPKAVKVRRRRRTAQRPGGQVQGRQALHRQAARDGSTVGRFKYRLNGHISTHGRRPCATAWRRPG